LGCKVGVGTILKAGQSGSGGDLVSFLVPSGIGVIVNARMSSQLVGAAESLAASRELTSVRLFSCVSTNVSRLMFKSMEGPVAQGAFVRSRKVLPLFAVVLVGQSSRHQADGGGHVDVCLG